VCTHLHVLDFGKPLFEGTPAQVRASAIVRAAYLGEDDEALAATSTTTTTTTATTTATATAEHDVTALHPGPQPGPTETTASTGARPQQTDPDEGDAA
jgi:hypothetical protein